MVGLDALFRGILLSSDKMLLQTGGNNDETCFEQLSTLLVFEVDDDDFHMRPD